MPAVLRIHSREDLRNLPSPTWLINEILPARGFCVLYGHSGVGKTFAALDMALSIATGLNWHGRDCKVGPVIYLLAEGQDGLDGRVSAWEIQNKMKVEIAGFITAGPQLLAGAEYNQLIELIKKQECPPSIVVIDTLARHTAGADENSQKEMGLLVRAVDEIIKTFACAVLLVHHTGKGQAKKAHAQERGSSVIRGAADTMIFVSSPSKGLIRIECDKQKESQSFAPLTLQLSQIAFEKNGRPMSSCVLTPIESSTGTREPLLTKNTNIVFLIVIDKHPAGGIRAKDLMSASGLTDATYFRTQKELVAMGLIEKSDDNYVLTYKGRMFALTISSSQTGYQ